MTVNNHSRLPENPPSESEEDETEVEEEVVNNEEEEETDDGEEEESGDDDEETEKSKFCVVQNPKPKSNDAEEEEDSDDDSESDELIPTQKKEEVKKPEQTSIPPAKLPVAKGQVEAEKSSKRRKKNNDGEEAEKKSVRVWTEEGEIVLLKGMIDYMKQGKNPNSDSNGFFEFIKGSINVDVTKEQLSSKIRHAKGRFRQNDAKEKSGEVLTFTKPHFQQCYELSKLIWVAENNKQENDAKEKKGGEATEVDGATNGKGKSKKRKANNDAGVSEKPEESTKVNEVAGKSKVTEVDGATDGKSKSKKKKASNDAGVSEKREESAKVNEVAGKSKVAVEKEEVDCSGLIELIQHMAPPGLKSSLNKRAYQLIEPSKRKAFEKRWKDLQVAEGELFLRRIDLVRELSSNALEALKSQTS